MNSGAVLKRFNKDDIDQVTVLLTIREDMLPDLDVWLNKHELVDQVTPKERPKTLTIQVAEDLVSRTKFGG